MGQPGIAGSQFPGEDSVMRELRDVRRLLQQVMAANPLATAGISTVPDGIKVEGSAEFTGDMTIGGTLNLPNGIINNDALANPILTETSSNFLSNYAVGTTSTVRATVTFAVPEGFTQAVVMANPTGMAQNTTSSVDYLYVQAVVNGVNGGELYTSAGVGLGVGLASPFHTTIYALSGGQEITVSVATRTGFNTWTASTANQANIYATVLFFR